MEMPDADQLIIIYRVAGIASKARARPKLMKVIRKAAAKRHIYIFAPSSFGKTATVLEWISELRHDAAWVSLNKSDGDSGIFFERLIQAFLRVQPDNAILKAKLDGAACVSLLAEKAACYLREDAVKSYIVLDGFEHITDEALLHDLIKVIRALPKGFTVIMIGRQEPHGLFSDLILRNLISVIRKEQLIF